MSLRMNRRTGRQFWSCTGWPDHCGETENYIPDDKPAAKEKVRTPSPRKNGTLSTAKIVDIITEIFNKSNSLARTAYIVLTRVGVTKEDVLACSSSALYKSVLDEIISEYPPDAPPVPVASPVPVRMDNEDLPF